MHDLYNHSKHEHVHISLLISSNQQGIILPNRSIPIEMGASSTMISLKTKRKYILEIVIMASYHKRNSVMSDPIVPSKSIGEGACTN